MAVKRISLGLQGGGAHGAFTWGVLDRLLQDERLEIAAISGTSAGAMNGAALKSGWIEGGREGARKNLDWLWSQLGAVQDMRMPGWMTGMMPLPSEMHAAWEQAMPMTFVDTWSRMFSPYAYGPFYQNPLTSVAERFDYDRVCAKDGPKLFVGATNVRTGRMRIFSGDEVSTDSLLASACLPTLFKAVEIDGEAYWDGGYTGNPALFPLFDDDLPSDILIVSINPMERHEVPITPQQIQNRINEISFNTSLLRELRSIGLVQKMTRNVDMPEGVFKPLHVHMIADDALMRDLSVTTKMVPSPAILNQLKEAGQVAAETFLSDCFDNIGACSSVDLLDMFD